MTEAAPEHMALSDVGARQLANATKSAPQLSTHHPAMAGAPAQLGAGRGRHLPAEPGGRIPRRSTSPAWPATSRSCRRRSSPYEEAPQGDLPERGVHDPGRPHARARSLLEPVRPDQGAAAADHRDDQGAAGERADQQPRATGCCTRSRTRSGSADPDRPADPGRPGQLDHQGVEGARVLPDPPRGDRRVRPGVHPPRGCRRPRSACSGRSSSPGADCRSSRRTRCRWRTARPRSSCSGRARSARAWSACSSRASPVSRARVCPCGSWASTARRSRPT